MFSPELAVALDKMKTAFDVVSIELVDHREVVIIVTDKLFNTQHKLSIPEINDVFKDLSSRFPVEEALAQIGNEVAGDTLFRRGFVRYVITNGLLICDN